MPRTYKKKPPRYTDQTVKKALEDIKDGHSIRKVSETHGISTGTLVRLKRRDRESENEVSELYTYLYRT